MAHKIDPDAQWRPPSGGLRARLRRLIWRLVAYTFLMVIAGVALYAIVPPPYTHTMWVERQRLGQIERKWVPIEEISPNMLRAAIAAEDANYCQHWGFDVAALRAVIAEGSQRGGSTISQQTVKNAYLWQERSWLRKAIEALLTPAVEAVWSKERILEVYLNVAEMGPGIFGVEAAAQHWFNISAAELTPRQAAALAAVLPNPKRRDPTDLSPALQRRVASIADGAVLISRDGRDDCVISP